MTADIDPGTGKRTIYRKDFWTGRLRPVGTAVSNHNETPETAIENGKEVPLTKSKPLPKLPDEHYDWQDEYD